MTKKGPQVQLTPREQEALSFIEQWHSERGYFPTQQEQADGMRVSRTRVRYLRSVLHHRGLLFVDGVRAIRLVASAKVLPILPPKD